MSQFLCLAILSATTWIGLIITGIVSTPAVQYQLLVEPLLNTKLMIGSLAQSPYYVGVYLVALAALYRHQKFSHVVISEFLLIAVGFVSFFKLNILTLMLLHYAFVFISSYTISRKDTHSTVLSRVYAITWLAVSLTILGALSWICFNSFGHINIVTELWQQLAAHSAYRIEAISLMGIIGLGLLAHTNLAPFSWFLRPLLSEFNCRQLAIYQIVSFTLLYSWFNQFLLPLIKSGSLVMQPWIIWLLAAGIAYHVAIVMSSVRLRELMYGNSAILLLLLILIALYSQAQSAELMIWGYSAIVLSTSFVGVIGSFFDHTVGSNSIPTIIHSSIYNRTLMRLLLVMLMAIMAIPGSMNFVFIYSALATSFRLNFAFGIVLLVLWIAILSSVTIKMGKILISMPAKQKCECLSIGWTVQIVLLGSLIFILGLMPHLIK